MEPNWSEFLEEHSLELGMRSPQQPDFDSPPPVPPQSPWLEAIMNGKVMKGSEGKTEYVDLQEFHPVMDVLDDQNHDIDRETAFASHKDAIQYRETLRQPKAVLDATIPRTESQKRGLVKLLFKAFKTTALAEDHEHMQRPFREQVHDNRLVEALCWQILELCILRAESAGPLLKCYEPAKAKNNTTIKTFANRLDEIILSMKECKTICKHLFDAPWATGFVDDPIRARARVKSNKDLNERKGALMAEGKKHVDTMKTEDELEDGISPNKRKRRAAPIKQPNSTPSKCAASPVTSNPPSTGTPRKTPRQRTRLAPDSAESRASTPSSNLSNLTGGYSSGSPQHKTADHSRMQSHHSSPNNEHLQLGQVMMRPPSFGNPAPDHNGDWSLYQRNFAQMMAQGAIQSYPMYHPFFHCDMVQQTPAAPLAYANVGLLVERNPFRGPEPESSVQIDPGDEQ